MNDVDVKEHVEEVTVGKHKVETPVVPHVTETLFPSPSPYVSAGYLATAAAFYP
jgi:hypothetical protein